jgi:tetratricopeptide (TPR) repeat protein
MDLADQASKGGQEDQAASYLEETIGTAQAGMGDLMQVPQQAADAMDKVAMGLYQFSRGDAALAAINYSLTLYPNYPLAMQHKAVILLSMNREIPTALQLLDQALAIAPTDKSIWASKGDAMRVLGNNQEAVECYLQAQQLDVASTQYVDRALKLSPKYPKALQMKLAISIHLGGTAEAISTCEQLISTSPEDPGLYYTLANLLSEQTRLDDALKALDRALGLLPENPAFLFTRARILRKMEDYPQAFALLRSLLERKADVDSGTLLEIIDAMEKSNLDAQLLELLRIRLLEVDPRNLANIQALRKLVLARGDKVMAIRATQAWLVLSPENMEAETALAELFKEVGDFDKALSLYEEIARHHPTEVQEIRKGLQLAHERVMYDRLVGLARAVLVRDPKDAVTMEWLGDAFTYLRRPQEALQVADDLLNIEPENISYLRRKKACLTALGSTSAVPAIIDKIFELDPTALDIALERARMYQYWAEHAAASSGSREKWAREALRSFERASMSKDYRSECYLGSAKTFHLVRDLDKAQESYRHFLELKENAGRGDIWKELGHVLRETGKNSEALESYQKAVELGCEHTDLLWGLVEVLRSLNQESKALHYLEVLVQREPHNPLFLRRHARLLLQTDKKQQGLSELKTALSLQEKDPSACFELADALKESGAYQDSLTYYHMGLQLDPHNQVALLSFSEALILTGRLPEAIAEIDALLRRDPTSLKSWRLRRDAFRSLKKDIEILYSLKAILLLNPNDQQAWEEKYRIHISRSEKQEAYEAIQAMVKITTQKADLSQLYMTKGDLESDLGKLDAALISYDEAAKVDPSVAYEATYRKAKTLGAHNKYEDTLKVLEMFGNPPFPAEIPDHLVKNVLNLRGVASFNLERYGEALEFFNDVVKKDPHDVDAAMWKAKSLLELGKHREAKDYLVGVIASFPNASADAYLCLSEAEAGLGSLDGAVEACLNGLKPFPNSAPLLHRLGDLKSKQEKWQDAADVYGRAIAVDKTNADVYIKMGQVHEKLQHPHEAIKVYEEATRLAPTNAHAHLRLGLALLDIGKPEEALTCIETALKIDPNLEAATEARTIAQQKVRENLIESYGKKALMLSSKLGRATTKNDLFMSLKVPWDLLDPVMREYSKVVEINLSQLTEKDVMDFEGMSYNIITQAFALHFSSVERGSLTQADVATLAPPDYTLNQIQRLFGYIQSVLSTPIRPETLKLPPDVENMARDAMSFPPEERDPFHLVKNLRIGLYKAMLIKTVEAMSMDSHASLPSVSFSANAPPPPQPQPQMPPQPPPQYPPSQYPPQYPQQYQGPPPPQPQPSPTVVDTTPMGPPQQESPAMSLTDAPEGARCSGCGGPANYVHTCGAYICRHCIVQFSSCPKCSLTLSLPSGDDTTPEQSRSAMEVPLALLPASKRVEERESAEGPNSTNRLRRLLGRSRTTRPSSATGSTGTSTTPSTTNVDTSSDKEEHL